MNRSTGHLLLSVLISASVPAVQAQDSSGESRRCLTLTRIDHTEIIDDQTVVFYLKGDDIYVNELDRPCDRLEREGRFSYRTSTGQLCSTDRISVLENSGFGGLREGFTCGLGRFRPADEAFVEMLKGEEGPADVTVIDIGVEDDEAEDDEVLE
jgi:hypothetical protein